MKKRLSLVIPFYNEEKAVPAGLPALISAVRASGILCRFVLVDNGSSDGTGRILREIASADSDSEVVRVPENQGYGWGIIKGAEQAKGDWIGFMGGDNQIRPESLIEAYRKMEAEELDLCKAARINRMDGGIRRCITCVYNRIVFPVLFRVPLADINGVPKIMTRELWDRMNISSKDWFIDAEIMIKAAALKASMGDVPVTFHARECGESKVNYGTIVEFAWNLVKYRFSSPRDGTF